MTFRDCLLMILVVLVLQLTDARKHGENRKHEVEYDGDAGTRRAGQFDDMELPYRLLLAYLTSEGKEPDISTLREDIHNFQKTPREDIDNFPKTHRKGEDNFQKMPLAGKDSFYKTQREDKDNFPKTPREDKDNFQKTHRKGEDNFQKMPLAGTDSFYKTPREDTNNFPKKPREDKDNFPKRPREDKDNFPKRPREDKDNFQKTQRKDKNNFQKMQREGADNFQRLIPEPRNDVDSIKPAYHDLNPLSFKSLSYPENKIFKQKDTEDQHSQNALDTKLGKSALNSPSMQGKPYTLQSVMPGCTSTDCDRPLCPWHFKWDFNPDRTPMHIQFAYCNSNSSCNFFGSTFLDYVFGHSTHCVQLFTEWDVQIHNVSTVIDVPIACVCKHRGGSHTDSKPQSLADKIKAGPMSHAVKLSELEMTNETPSEVRISQLPEHHRNRKFRKHHGKENRHVREKKQHSSKIGHSKLDRLN